MRNHGGALIGSHAVKRALSLRGQQKEFYMELAVLILGQDPDTFEHLEDDTYRIRPVPEFDIPLEKATFAVLDIETTGGKPPNERITEIAILRLDSRGHELARFSTLINPRKKIPPYVVKHTGISDTMVRAAPYIEEVMPEVIKFLDGNILVVHDSFADMQFLDYDADRLFSGYLALPLMNTQHLAERFLKEVGGLGLTRVAEHIGIEIGQRHRAMADAELTSQVFFHFLNKLNGKSIYEVYLDGAEESFIRPGSPRTNGNGNGNGEVNGNRYNTADS
jgi:DNA polymerase III epsilon subunit family exonuclease